MDRQHVTTNEALKGRVCLVTGASRGIGRAVADALGRAGGTVIGTATTDDGAAAISARQAAASIAGRGARLDVTDGAGVDALIASIGAEFGAVAVLVNNAGVTRDNLLMRMKEQEWDAILDTNLKSLYRVTRSCLRGMTRARYGRIVNVASVVAATGNAGQCNYAAAKAGMIGFTKSLARELAPRNVLVNVVAPGFIDTDMTVALDAARRESMLDAIPLARFGTPEDVAAAVLFLVSAGADYITGQTLHVNGGMFMA